MIKIVKDEEKKDLYIEIINKILFSVADYPTEYVINALTSIVIKHIPYEDKDYFLKNIDQGFEQKRIFDSKQRTIKWK